MTPAQLLSALAAVRHYAVHDGDCDTVCLTVQPCPCTCGLDDVLRGIDAMLAGRDVGKPDTAMQQCPTCGEWWTGKGCTLCKNAPGTYIDTFIDKWLAGNHPEAPESSKESDDGN